MTTKTTHHKLPCPHPGCLRVLKVPDSAPAGDYPCLCQAQTLRLSFAYYLERGSVPSLAVVEKEGSK